MRKKNQIIFLMLLLVALMIPRPSSAQTTIIDLGTLSGDQSQAISLNDHGQIAGYSRLASGEFHAFLWQAGALTDLGHLGGNTSFVGGLNNQGQVVGSTLF